jgi:hypothetical protein
VPSTERRAASGDHAGVVTDPLAAVRAQERTPGDVSDPGAGGNRERNQIPGAVEHLEIGKADQDHIARLDVAQFEGEDVLARRLGPGHATALRLELRRQFARLVFLLCDRPDDPSVHDHLAAVNGGTGRQGEGVGDIQRDSVGLVEHLVDSDVGDVAKDIEVEVDSIERQPDSGLIEPGDQPQNGFVAARLVGFHFRRVLLRVDCRLSAVVGTEPDAPESRSLMAQRMPGATGLPLLQTSM